MSHNHVIQANGPRLSADQLARFDRVAQCLSASCVFADVQGRAGVMHSAIKPAFRAKLVGSAVTVKLDTGDLQDPLAAIDIAGPGDVIVVDAGGDTEVSVCGGLMGGLAKNRGIRGMVIDGAGRDVDELRELEWPIFTRAITARGTHTMFSGRKNDVSVNIPIVCGGVLVHPGDLIVADEIGIAVIPVANAERVIALAAEQAEREQRTREQVAKGRTIAQILEEFGRI
ncbi:MAG TPA: RraA family protein [Rubrivivax sp.]|nr:RraA family protein [Rubrivivax sp.]